MSLAVIGVAEVPTKRDPSRTRWEILKDVCVRAIEDAGIGKDDIEAVLSVNPMAQPSMALDMALGRIPEVLGLNGCKDICVMNSGGTSTTNCVRLANAFLSNGWAKFVLIPHTTVQSDIPTEDLINFFATAPLDPQWEYPYGVTFNGAMGLITNRYMHETGTTPEDMASVTVGLRGWAALDPMSIFYGKPVTLEDVLNSRMISTPLHAKECNFLADGGGAMVVTTHEIAKELGRPAAYELGHDMRFMGATPVLRSDVFSRESYRGSSQGALEKAGLTINDMDLRQIYGAYPYTQCSALEGYGVCEIGEAREIVGVGRVRTGREPAVHDDGGCDGPGSYRFRRIHGLLY